MSGKQSSNKEKVGGRIWEEDQPPPYGSASSLTNLNQIDTRPDSGKMLIMGQLDEPADVAVATNSNPALNADVDINHVFRAYADVDDGTNTLTVTATDKSGNSNQTSTNYSFSVSADTFTDPVYDADGNMLQDGTGRSYVWDQESRLTRINCPSGEYTTFAYNAFSQRIRKTEHNSSGTPTSDIAYIWCSGTQPCESRDFGTPTTVLTRYYPQGEQRIGGADAGDYYYFKDHLGSISEMVDASENVRSQYEYDPYGRQSANLITSNPLESQFGYTGHFTHSESGLVLTWYRAYDPEMGIWISRDPIGEAGGINLYGYVANNPVNYRDPLGLWQFTIQGGYGLGGRITFGVNSGQLNVGAQIGFAVGLSASLDVTDSGRKCPGEETNFIGSAAVGSGVIGGSGVASFGEQRLQGSLRGSAGPIWGGVGGNVNGPGRSYGGGPSGGVGVGHRVAGGSAFMGAGRSTYF